MLNRCGKATLHQQRQDCTKSPPCTLKQAHDVFCGCCRKPVTTLVALFVAACIRLLCDVCIMYNAVGLTVLCVSCTMIKVVSLIVLSIATSKVKHTEEYFVAGYSQTHTHSLSEHLHSQKLAPYINTHTLRLRVNCTHRSWLPVETHTLLE